jgi:hypothetical protein
MERTRYKLTGTKIAGYFIITYINGCLKSVLNEFKEPLNETQWWHIISLVPVNAAKFKTEPFKAVGLQVELNPNDAPAETENATESAQPNRVALFCMYYKRAFSQAYTATRADGAKLKALPVSAVNFEPLLKAYFASTEWYLTPKSIGNFVGKINEIKLLQSNPNALVKKTKFPIPFDAGYNNTLDQGKRQEYYKALREAGYRYRDIPGRGGKWEKVV